MRRTVLLLALIWPCLSMGKVTITTEDGQVIELNKKDETDEVIEQAMKTYSRTVSDLARRLKEPDASNMTKVKMIYALGQLRALAARMILIENINLLAEQMDPTVRIARWGPYPAREALVNIGRPRSWMLLGVIGSQKFREARVDGYAEVLAGIEGPEGAVMKLKDRMRQAKDSAAKRQYQMVIDGVEAIRELRRAGKQTKQSRADEGDEPGT
ncbi:MAG: hypothetical protein ACYTEX_26905, partial [Planctomycetota bacterium]